MRIKNISKRKKILIIASSAFTISTIALGTTLYTTLKSKEIDNNPNENNMLNIKNNEKGKIFNDSNNFEKLNKKQDKLKNFKQNDSNIKSDNSKSNDSLKPTQPLLDSDKNKTDSKLIDNSNENNKLKSETQLDKNHFS
ncbi:hypothetical protein, partial [Mycoplasmopsis cricetuli]|uniref:hypothetical protein n=1 Tax=Mycoplasmopsis cricetuli TaxID=171283 RepID=UPI00056AB72F